MTHPVRKEEADGTPKSGSCLHAPSPTDISVGPAVRAGPDDVYGLRFRCPSLLAPGRRRFVSPRLTALALTSQSSNEGSLLSLSSPTAMTVGFS